MASLSQREQTLLIFTALFHDSAKPLTSQVDEEPATFARRNTPSRANIWFARYCGTWAAISETRKEIARLVRFHGRPQFLLERAEPKHEVVSLSWWVSNRLLYLFGSPIRAAA